MESLLEEYRELASVQDAVPSANNETVVKLTQEKEQLIKELGELSQTVNDLKLQLDVAESKVSRVSVASQLKVFQNLGIFLGGGF